MAINVSVHQLCDRNLVEKLNSCLVKYDVSAELIDIEVTETALLKETVEALSALIAINKLKCRLSLDDFGTGYSSVSHLRNYPISVMKIDKSLIPINDADLKNIALVEGLVSMASVLGLEVVAEGVETEYQVSLCNALKITHVQGYYFSKPKCQKDIELQYLNTHFIQVN